MKTACALIVAGILLVSLIICTSERWNVAVPRQELACSYVKQLTWEQLPAVEQAFGMSLEQVLDRIKACVKQ